MLPDDTREHATEGGWNGPWELTTWAHLVLEVISHSTIPAVDLPDVPRERGVRTTDLYYYTTPPDAWGSNAARPKEKSALYWVTAESTFRDKVLQVPGGVAQRVGTPFDPSSTRQVQVLVRMVVIPHKEIYSIGATFMQVPKEQVYATAMCSELPDKKVRSSSWQSFTSGLGPLKVAPF